MLRLLCQTQFCDSLLSYWWLFCYYSWVNLAKLHDRKLKFWLDVNPSGVAFKPSFPYLSQYVPGMLMTYSGLPFHIYYNCTSTTFICPPLNEIFLICAGVVESLSVSNPNDHNAQHQTLKASKCPTPFSSEVLQEKLQWSQASFPMHFLNKKICCLFFC